MSGTQHRGIDLPTLLLTAVASAVAAYTCSRLWAPGTLPSAAAMPVLVALIREGLQRPTEAVTRAVPARGASLSAGQADVRGSRPRRAPQAEPPARVARPEPPTRVARPESRATVGQARAIGGTPSGWDRRWRLAIVTGLLGFAVCVIVFTVPELVAGGSASGGGRATTLFGGERSKDAERARERDRERGTTSPGPTVTAPGRTVTVPPSARTPPAATAPAPAPRQTVPPPTTPAPAPRAPGQP